MIVSRLATLRKLMMRWSFGFKSIYAQKQQNMAIPLRANEIKFIPNSTEFDVSLLFTNPPSTIGLPERHLPRLAGTDDGAVISLSQTGYITYIIAKIVSSFSDFQTDTNHQ